MFIVQQAAAKQATISAAGGDTMRIREYVVSTEFGSEDPIDEAFLGLALNEYVKTDQREGLPPTTFFSHNSDKV
jgi:hypothetical protein